MKAISIDDDGLSWATTERPRPKDDEVLLRVAATACNRADLLQRRGHYPPPPGASPILGLEASGVIEETGSQVHRWEPGQRACALLAGGGHAEYVAVPADHLLPIPSTLRLIEAAALPEVFATAYLNLFWEADLQPAETALIHAAASGVGTAAVQLCGAFDITAFGTASESKLAFLHKLGIAQAFDRHHQSFGAEIDQLTDRRGVDVILDPVGADYFTDNLHLLKTGGRLVVIGLLGGRSASLPLDRLLMKRLRIIGSVLRSRSAPFKAKLIADMTTRVWPLFEDGTLKPVIDDVYPLAEIEEAHKRMLDNQTIGKLVLTIDPTL